VLDEGPVPSQWLTPAVTPVTPTTTANGLPVRTPGARTLPAERPKTTPQTGFRDPESIRSNLSRHYDGVLAARRARERPGTAE
ncbi:MAG: hypothetical protein M3422_10835, partial [Actinomycetota bacterium]|nr:hypothetical protein [Actinomycetota bacterium]